MVEEGAQRLSRNPLTTGNARVKETRKLSRRSERSERRLFLADGPKAVEGALEVPGCVVEVFATQAATEQYAELAATAPLWTLVEDRALASLSDSVNPAGMVAVCRFLDRPLAHILAPLRPVVEEGALAPVSEPPKSTSRPVVEEGALAPVSKPRKPTSGSDPVSPGFETVAAQPPQPTSRPVVEEGALAPVSKPRLVAICADVRDPGNAGTVIRCADAAGADLVVMAGNSVDVYNPKTVRASVGSLFHLPIAVEPDPVAAVRAARAAGLLVLAADGAGEIDLDEADELLATPTAWLFGNEAWGLPDDLAALADHRVRIPIHGRAESLNLSTAAALCLYASARAHRRR